MKLLLYQETGVKVCASGGQIVLDIFTGRVPLTVFVLSVRSLYRQSMDFVWRTLYIVIHSIVYFYLLFIEIPFKKFYRHENLFELRVFLNLQWSHFQRPKMSVHK